MILLVDNYDSFVYNLYQMLRVQGRAVRVVRNDRITSRDVSRLQPDALVISPGPGIPSEAGACLSLIRDCHRQIPVLGICLGHQAIGEAFGARITGAREIFHGKTDILYNGGQGLFSGLPPSFPVARYHSLVVEAASLPDCLEVTARTGEGTILALAHREHPVYGLQFHPESIMTEHGADLMERFLGEVDNRCSKN